MCVFFFYSSQVLPIKCVSLIGHKAALFTMHAQIFFLQFVHEAME